MEPLCFTEGFERSDKRGQVPCTRKKISTIEFFTLIVKTRLEIRIPTF